MQNYAVAVASTLVHFHRLRCTVQSEYLERKLRFPQLQVLRCSCHRFKWRTLCIWCIITKQNATVITWTNHACARLHQRLRPAVPRQFPYVVQFYFARHPSFVYEFYCKHLEFISCFYLLKKKKNEMKKFHDNSSMIRIHGIHVEQLPELGVSCCSFGGTRRHRHRARSPVKLYSWANQVRFSIVNYAKMSDLNWPKFSPMLIRRKWEEIRVKW